MSWYFAKIPFLFYMIPSVIHTPWLQTKSKDLRQIIVLFSFLLLLKIM